MNIIETGYDKIAQVYNRRRHLWSNSEELEDLVKRLPEGATVLDAGCGPGHASRFLARRGFSVTGIDISRQMLELAQKKVPRATFLRMDMRKMSLPATTFDGVVCLYAIIHVARRHHQEILSRFYTLLKPAGFLLLLTGWDDYVGIESDYLVRGTRMQWSYFGKEANLRMVKQAGFRVIWFRPDQQHDGTHLLILARK